jgi:hypothetical protein
VAVEATRPCLETFPMSDNRPAGSMRLLISAALMMLSGCTRLTQTPPPVPHPCSPLHYYDPGCCHHWDWPENKCGAQ